MYGLMGDPKYLTSIFLRSNFAQFMPQGSESDFNILTQTAKYNNVGNSKIMLSQTVQPRNL